MFQHFSALAKDISAIVKEYVLKLSKQKIPVERFIVYNKFFRLPTNVQKALRDGSCKYSTVSYRSMTSCHFHLYVTHLKGNSICDFILIY